MVQQRSAGKKRPPQKKKAAAPKPDVNIAFPSSLTVKQMADTLAISHIEAIKHVMRKGVMANVNQAIDYEIAASIASDLGFEPTMVDEVGVTEKPAEEETPEKEKPAKITKKEAKNLKPRPAVVTVLGHVDHGKTSLLDAIRKTNVVDGEAGAITQHIGAYKVNVEGQEITFIDTPGHEAFTEMRARGASVTDIAILVVAAEDGLMPQTLEAIGHAKAAEVPIIVAINKIDKPNADPDKVKQQLAEQNLLIEEWGGEVIAIQLSAKTGEGLPELLEHILLVAEMGELKANPDAPARGVVIEAKLDNSRGILSTLLIQSGTLKAGDIVVVKNAHYGKIKAMFDHNGNRIKSAGPSTPVEIMGMSETPQAGDPFTVVKKDKEAKAIVEKYQAEQQALKSHGPTLDEISAQIRAGETKGINLILKADVQGSIDPIRSSLAELENEEVRIRVVHSSTGNISESDVMLAVASNAIIIGFNTKTEPRAKKLSEIEGIEIRNYQIIYKLIEDMESTVTGMLEPTYIDVIDGHAEVRALFKVKSATIAGCYIIDGKASSSSLARVFRNKGMIHESSVSSLKHFKDNVKEMSAGSECGIGVEGFSEFEINDIIELYHKEKQ